MWPQNRQYSALRLNRLFSYRHDLLHRPVDGSAIGRNRHRQEMRVQPRVEFVHKHKYTAGQADNHQQRSGPEPEVQMQPEPYFAPNLRPMAPALRASTCFFLERHRCHSPHLFRHIHFFSMLQ